MQYLVQHLLLTFILIAPTTNNKEEKYTNPIRQTALCTPTVKLQNCKKGIVNKRYTYYLYYQGADITVGCAGNKIDSSEWLYSGNIMGTKSIVKNKKVLRIAPRDVIPGDYNMTLKVKESPGEWASDTCPVKFITEPPVIIFKQGHIQYVTVGDTYMVDLTPSINYNDQVKLVPEWSVQCTNFNTPSCKSIACDIKPTGLSFKQKHNGCYHKLQFLAKLMHDDYKIEKSHVVYFQTSADMTIKLECDKNCDADGRTLSNPESAVSLNLVCIKNCETFDGAKPTWSVRDVKRQSYMAEKVYTIIHDNLQMLIKPNVLGYESNYIVRANISLSMALFSIDTLPKIEKPECDIQPRSGISMTTVFKMSCKTKGYLKKNPPFYQIHSEKSGGTTKGLLLAESAFSEFDFVLASTKYAPFKNLQVTGHDLLFNKFHGNAPTIKVAERVVQEKEVNATLALIENLFSDGNIGLAVQYAHGLLTEVNTNLLSDAVVKRTYAYIIESMLKVEIESIYSFRQMAAFIPAFRNTKIMDDKTKLRLSILCSKMAKIEVQGLLRSKYSKTQELEAKDLSKMINTCADALIDAEAETETTTQTTIQVHVSEPIVEEIYPDYDYDRTNHEIEEAHKNAVDSVFDMAKAISATLANGESHHSKEGHFETDVVIANTKNLAGKVMKANSTQVTVTTDILKYPKKKVAAVLTEFNSALLGSPSAAVSTNVADLHFYSIENQTLNAIDVKFNLTFNVTKNQKFEFIYGFVRVPGDIALWKVPEINFAMRVHRIQLAKYRKCSIMFKNLKIRDKLQVTITRNRRPDFDDFSNSIVVDSNNTKSHFIEFPLDSISVDVFIYVAILPHPDMLPLSSDLSVPYYVHFSEQECVIFDRAKHNWQSAPCEVYYFQGAESSIINCNCKHASLFAAITQTVPSKLDEVKIKVFETEAFVTYTILWHVVIIFACYCIALCFVILREKRNTGKDKIYFLSDNVKNDRYAYAIFIKTGSIPGSGTTSNIAIRLLGTIADSKPHVLNYPDPNKKILQNDKVDCFILATEHYLGDIKRLQLWFDSVGLRPSWYCQNIAVLDLQNHAKYTFNIESWLDVTQNSIKLEAKAEEGVKHKMAKQDSKLASRKAFKFYFDALNTWNIFENGQDNRLLYSERITVILSMIYTSYFFNMMMLARPSIRSYDAYVSIEFHKIIFFGMGTSLLSSLVNLPFILIFRNSKKPDDELLLIHEVKKTFSKRIAWMVLCPWICFCMIYLILIGFWIPLQLSYVWILSNVISTLISILLIENVYHVCLNFIILKYFKVPIQVYNFKCILKEIEKQRRQVFKKFGEVLFRPYFRSKYYLMEFKDMLDKKRSLIKRNEISSRFKQMCKFLVFTFILLFLTVLNHDTMAYWSNRSMVQLFADGDYGEMSLDDIHIIEDIYDYIADNIITITHPKIWYGRWNSVDPGHLIDFNTKILGIVQLRQQRYKTNCVQPLILKDLNIPCNINHEHKRKFSKGRKISASLGRLKFYHGDGYSVTLGRTLHNSNFILKVLREHKWLDQHMSALFIEFWTYNANTNIFNSVRIMIERDLSGDLIKTLNVYTRTFIGMDTIMEIFVDFCSLLIMAVKVIIFIKKVTTFVRTRNVPKNLWTLVDLAILLFSFIVLVIYIIKNRMLNDVLDKLMNSNHNKFVDYFRLMRLSYILWIMSAILVCISVIRLWEFFRFSRVCRIMEMTIYTSSEMLLITFIFNAWVIFIFTITAFILYGTTFEVFCDIPTALTTVVLSATYFDSGIDFDKFYTYGTSIYIWYSALMLVGTFFITVYTAILMLSHVKMQNWFSNLRDEYTLKNYVKDEREYFKAIYFTKRRIPSVGGSDDGTYRLKAGGDEEKVYAKADAHRYVNCVLLPDHVLRLMNLYALYVVKNSLQIPNDNMMERVFLENFASKQNIDKSHIFLTGSGAEGVKLVHDNRMLQMEYIVKRLFNEGERNESKPDGRVVISLKSGADRLEECKKQIKYIALVIQNIRIRVS